MRPSASFWRGKTLDKNCGLFFTVNTCFSLWITCLTLTHSVSPGSLSCQSHSPCLWKYYSKWKAQTSGHVLSSTGMRLFDLLVESEHWIAMGRQDLCKVNIIYIFAFLYLVCVCNKSKAARHNPMVALTLSCRVGASCYGFSKLQQASSNLPMHASGKRLWLPYPYSRELRYQIQNTWAIPVEWVTGNQCHSASLAIWHL